MDDPKTPIDLASLEAQMQAKMKGTNLGSNKTTNSNIATHVAEKANDYLSYLEEAAAAAGEVNPAAKRNVEASRMTASTSSSTPSTTVLEEGEELELPMESFVSTTPRQAIVATPTVQRQTVSSTSINTEHEPTGLVWNTTNIVELVNLYPPSKRVDDLQMTIQGALQQPGMPFGMLTPTGTGFFIKSTPAGQLLVAWPSGNPKAFANPGYGPDGDNDADDVEAHTAMAPLSGVKSSQLPRIKLAPVIKRPSIDEGVDPFDSLLAEKFAPEDRSVISKLLENKVTKISPKKVSTTTSSSNVTVEQFNQILCNVQRNQHRNPSKTLTSLVEVLTDISATTLLSDEKFIPTRLWEVAKAKCARAGIKL